MLLNITSKPHPQAHQAIHKMVKSFWPVPNIPISRALHLEQLSERPDRPYLLLSDPNYIYIGPIALFLFDL